MEQFKILSVLSSGHEIVINDSNLLNIRDLEGNLLSDFWFDSVSEKFIEGFIIVRKYNKYNFLSVTGELLLDQWCYDCFPFFNGKSIIFPKEGEINVIDIEGNYLYPDSHLELGEPRLTNFLIGFDNQYYYLTPEGERLLPDIDIHDYLTDDNNKLLFIKDSLGDWRCYRTEDDTLLSYEFWDVVPQNNNLFKVQFAEGLYNFINLLGERITPNDFKYCYDFHDNVAVIVNQDDTENYLTSKGTILFPDFDFVSCKDFKNGLSEAEDFEGNRYQVTPEGVLTIL